MSTVLPGDPSVVPAEPIAAHSCRTSDGGAAVHAPHQAGVIAAAVLAQGVALAPSAGAPGIVLAAVAAGACALAWEQRARIAHADVVIATGVFGGVGMLAGDWIARALATPPAHHGGMPHGGPVAGSWLISAGVMLLTCAAACRWSCVPLCSGGWRRRTLAHLAMAGGMIGGMRLAGAVLATTLPHPAVHVAMVLGMTAGVAAVLPLVARLDGRRGTEAR